MVKGKSDHYFLVGVNENEFNARAILVKGSRYPQTVPRPVVAVISLSIPICSSIEEKDTLESAYWTADIKSRAYENGDNVAEDAISENRDNQMQCLVKLFALACKSDHESRAVEICKLMDLQTIQIAIQVLIEHTKFGLRPYI
jgi:chromosome transmission fidelity protein 4